MHLFERRHIAQRRMSLTYGNTYCHQSGGETAFRCGKSGGGLFHYISCLTVRTTLYVMFIGKLVDLGCTTIENPQIPYSSSVPIW